VPGQSPSEATDAFLAPIREALSCVARAKIITSPGGRHSVDVPHSWTINNDRGADLGHGQVLSARMRYRIIRDDREGCGPFRATTDAYMYELADGAHELFALYWHPLGNSLEKLPHFHLGDKLLRDDAPIDSKSHMPMPRASFEQAVRWVIEFKGAVPLVQDWDDRLTVCETRFKLYRSWHTHPDEATAGKQG